MVIGSSKLHKVCCQGNLPYFLNQSNKILKVIACDLIIVVFPRFWPVKFITLLLVLICFRLIFSLVLITLSIFLLKLCRKVFFVTLVASSWVKLSRETIIKANYRFQRGKKKGPSFEYIFVLSFNKRILHLPQWWYLHRLTVEMKIQRCS